MTAHLSVALALAALMVGPVRAHAQTPAATLQPGTWSGSSVGPDTEVVKLVFDVTSSGDSISIVARTQGYGSYPFSNIRLVNDTLRFSFEPGPQVECVLPKEADGSFAGRCTAGETGETATLRMIPPRP